MCKKIEGTRVEIRPSDKPGAKEFLENQNNLSQSLTYMIDMWIDLFGDGDIMANLTDNIKSVITMTNDISIDEVSDASAKGKPEQPKSKSKKSTQKQSPVLEEVSDLEVPSKPEVANNSNDDLAAMGLDFAS